MPPGTMRIAPESFKPGHEPSATPDCPVILSGDVVQILVLADLDRRVALGVQSLGRVARSSIQHNPAVF
jgi:hypothetical protein